MTARTLAASAIGIVLMTAGLDAQDLLPSHRIAAPSVAGYRTFALKSDLAAVSTGAGMAASEAKVIHQRPALLQELGWRPSRWVKGSSLPSTDPVEQIVFSFYNDQLFRVVVDYDRDRVEGLTDADMVEAIAAVYGTPGGRVTAADRVPTTVVEAESGSPVARWAAAGHTVVLYRTSMSRVGFRLIVTEPDLDSLARKAAAQAGRLDEQDAPRLEIARQKTARAESRAAAEKVRVVNKAGFRP